MNGNIEKPTFKQIVLLNLQQLTNFPYIEKDFDALTDYGLLSKVVDKMNEVITNNNIQNESINALYNAFIELKDYVDNYFDSLDVQEDINDKLDKMAEDGTLTELIKNYIDPKYEAYEEIIDNRLLEQDEEIAGFKTVVNEQVSTINAKVDEAVSGSPLVASSTSEMTDTSRIYVNTTDGHWYWYDGTEWQDGGIYQSTGIANNTITKNMLNSLLQDEINEKTIKNDYKIKRYEVEQGSFGDGGVDASSDVRVRLKGYVTFGEDVYFYIPAGGLLRILKNVSGTKTVIFNEGTSANYGFIYYLPYDETAEYRVCYGYNDNSAITPSDVSNYLIYAMTTDKTATSIRKVDIPFVKGRIDNSTGLDIKTSGTSYQFIKTVVPIYLPEGTKFINPYNTIIGYKYNLDGTFNSRFSIGGANRLFGDSGYLYRFSFYKENGDFSTTDTSIFLTNDSLINNMSLAKDIIVNYEDGSFDSAGDNTASTNTMRTQKIPVINGKTYLILFPSNFKANINRKSSYMDNRNSGTGYSDVPFSFNDCSDFIRVSYKKTDDSAFSVSDLSTSTMSNFRIIELTPSSEYNAIIGNANSFNKINAHLIVDGNNDRRILQGLINCLDSIKIKLLDGIFQIGGTPWATTKSGQRSLLYTAESNSFATTPSGRNVVINGYEKGRSNSPRETILNISSLTVNDSNENSAILVPRENSSLSTETLSPTQFEISNLTILSNAYTHNFICIDATHGRSNNISNIDIRMNGSTSGASRLATMPNENAIGIRAGYGSNNGIQNYIKNCLVFGAGKGYSICGEHYIIEDCLAHHCKIGFAFGDRETRGKMEHPNIMLGCSIEGCYRFMLLTKNGNTTEKDYEASDANNGIYRSTLIVIGLSTEDMWSIPTDELVDGEPDRSITLPILEIIRGAYRGRIEMDNSNPIFASGSGKGFMVFRYSGSGLTLSKGANVNNYL